MFETRDDLVRLLVCFNSVYDVFPVHVSMKLFARSLAINIVFSPNTNLLVSLHLHLDVSTLSLSLERERTLHMHCICSIYWLRRRGIFKIVGCKWFSPEMGLVLLSCEIPLLFIFLVIETYTWQMFPFFFFSTSDLSNVNYYYNTY